MNNKFLALTVAVAALGTFANVDAASGNRGTPFELIMSVPDALIASKGDHHKPRQRQHHERKLL